MKLQFLPLLSAIAGIAHSSTVLYLGSRKIVAKNNVEFQESIIGNATLYVAKDVSILMDTKMVPKSVKKFIGRNYGPKLRRELEKLFELFRVKGNRWPSDNIIVSLLLYHDNVHQILNDIQRDLCFDGICDVHISIAIERLQSCMLADVWRANTRQTCNVYSLIKYFPISPVDSESGTALEIVSPNQLVLPADTYFLICTHLPPHYAVLLRLVSKTFHAAIQSCCRGRSQGRKIHIV